MCTHLTYYKVRPVIRGYPKYLNRDECICTVPATTNERTMTPAKTQRNVCITIGFVLLVFALVVFTSAVAQDAAARKNPYLVRTFVDEEGREIAEIVVPGRPPEIKAEVAMVPESNIAMGTNSLLDVPTFDWCYGCSATAAAMMFGYYDRTGYSNMYAGPTNGGVCPLTNTVWGSGECPLSATHRYYDGLAVRGHVDDYWYSYNSTVDPYYGNWPEHGYADCTADFMGTNQYVHWLNQDGATTFYYYTSGAPLYDYSGCEPTKRDGTHGMRLFVESRGYNVLFYGGHYQNYFQLIYGYEGNTQGFTFDQYKAEIDAGRPVIIQVEGHSMLGYGYNDPNTVYLHDTWDHSSHAMTWGGTYPYGSQNLQHYAVTVIQLAALPP
ncbi:MAG: C39 family peptidase, partial [Candidatus Methanospirareceae archaeon]